MDSFREVFDKQLTYFKADHTKTYAWRIDQLDRMTKMLSENESELRQAVGQDFKTTFSEQVFEVPAPLDTIKGAKMQLQEWMLPQEAILPKFLRESGHKGIVYREPYGVTLVIAPFNGPLLLSLDPALTALTVGNSVILKISNALPNTSELLRQLVARYFEPESFTVVTADRDAIAQLLKLPFDFIFFTGSTQVGKVVMRAAAENLTPVLLEPGGQNPVIVGETADIADAARKAIWGATA